MALDKALTLGQHRMDNPSDKLAGMAQEKSLTVLRCEKLNYHIGQFTLPEFSLELLRGEYIALLGPSGSGKSVILELIAGLRKVESGQILCFCGDGEGQDKTLLTDITGYHPQKRPIGILFQDYALFPHRSVYNNIAYALILQHISKAAIAEEVSTLASKLEISPLLKRQPDTLSGGEKQRVALARTLATHPRVLLLDEPTAALDAPLRQSSLSLLKGLTSTGLSILHVTHDIAEAETVADRLIHLSK